MRLNSHAFLKGRLCSVVSTGTCWDPAPLFSRTAQSSPSHCSTSTPAKFIISNVYECSDEDSRFIYDTLFTCEQEDVVEGSTGETAQEGGHYGAPYPEVAGN